jgi:hypothetical protein
MAIKKEKIEDALEMALTTLAGVAATGSNEEKIAASKMLMETVKMASNQKRRSMLADRVMPLIDSVTWNLAAQLADDAEFAPAYVIDATSLAS